MPFQITGACRTVIGENAVASCSPVIKKFGKKALIVSGKILTSKGFVELLSEKLGSWGIDSEVFNDIEGEPTDTMVTAGVDAYRKAGCDFVIGFGGGSPLDTAKAVTAMSVLPGTVTDYAGKEIDGQFPPLVLIPTTAGTGSEATKFLVITDTKHDVKLLLKGEALLPSLAVVDYTYTLSTPCAITAATGMDALTHAVEAYTSKKADFITDLYAVDAVKRIFSYLPRAYTDGSDRKARGEMSIAAYEAGFCINNSSVTLVHGMSRPVGALFHVPHGISNAMLLTECLRFALDGCPERFVGLGRAIGAAEADSDDRTASEAFFSALEHLCDVLEIPTLERYGIDRNLFLGAVEKMASDALESGSPSNTVKIVTKDDVISIYERLWK